MEGMVETVKWILFAISLPWTLTVSWPWVLLMVMIRAAGELQWEGRGVLTAIWRPWAAKRWRWSTTLGHGIVYQDVSRAPKGSPWTTTQDHEHVHVRQVQDQMFVNFICGAIVLTSIGLSTGDWSSAVVYGFALWWSGGLWQVPNFITAGIRHGWTLKGIYNGSEHERSAYAQTSPWRGRKSWLNGREK